MPALELRQPGPGPLRLPAGTAGLPGLPAVSGGVDRAIRVSTAAVVLSVAGIAAYTPTGMPAPWSASTARLA